MIPSDLAARLRMLTEASFFDSEPPVQGTAKVREIQARLPQLVPGQQFTATLMRGLPDGTYQAVVAGRNYTLALNQSAKPGDTLELVVTKNTPGALYAQPAPTPAAAADPARANLSPTGRLISFLLTGQPEPQPAQLAAGKPLLSAPPASGAPLAPVLRQALAQTGLFYESHQLQWLSGKLDTAQLLKEPQGQQPGNAQASVPANAQAAASRPMLNAATLLSADMLARTAAGQAAKYLELGPSPDTGRPNAAAERGAAGALSKDAAGAVQRTPPASQANPASTANNATTTAARSTEGLAGQQAAADSAQVRAPTVPDRLVPVVHQQLNAMATQTYVWHGQAWPGQMMEWEIEDPQHEHHAHGDEPEDTWNTTLRLTLPQLGGVEARMNLTPAGVALRLIADDPATATALDEAREKLDTALSAANVPLTGFVVETGDEQ